MQNTGRSIIEAERIVAKMQQVSCGLITLPLILIRSDWYWNRESEIMS